MIPDLAIVVPTLNERDNVEPLVERIGAVLPGVAWEVIFVDDGSTDGTLDRLQGLARKDERVRYLRRFHRRGLSSACIEGMAASSAPLLAVMDADLQHDEALLPEMVRVVGGGEADLAVGSRYVAQGGVGEWSAGRQRISRLATTLGNALLRTSLSDPMSGFFLLRREVFEAAAPRLSGQGFKILIDLVSSHPEAKRGGLRVRELPYVFRERHAGESKLDSLTALEYLWLLADKTIGRVVPTRFVLFVAVGSLGAMLHLGILGFFVGIAGRSFALGQSLATAVAIVSNFTLNNVLTHRDRRLRGAARWRGLAGFMAVSAIGALANVQIALALYEKGIVWWMAGLLGAGVGAVWNYAVSSVFVWSRVRVD